MAVAALPGVAASAKVIVAVPADAELYIDGKKSQSTSETRTFVSPKLEAGQKYYYDIKAEVVRDGKVVTDSKRITIRGGDVARVDFSDLSPTTTRTESAPAQVTVRLPQDAKLYVDGKVLPLTSGKRTFSTPKLEAGRTFYYDIKAEVVRDGKKLQQSERVVVEAGKQVEITLDNLTKATSTASR